MDDTLSIYAGQFVGDDPFHLCDHPQCTSESTYPCYTEACAMEPVLWLCAEHIEGTGFCAGCGVYHGVERLNPNDELCAYCAEERDAWDGEPVLMAIDDEWLGGWDEQAE